MKPYTQNHLQQLQTRSDSGLIGLIHGNYQQVRMYDGSGTEDARLADAATCSSGHTSWPPSSKC